MAHEKKASSGLSVAPCSRQDGKVRYPDKEDVEVPSVSMFRNNLTAFSQYRNLLFVAYDDIHVYSPSFPEQTITTKPELVISLPRFRRSRRGYLDPSKPHAVNHLIVGDMGDEEIMVVACDDGDVISYTVRSISLAIEEGAKNVFAPEPCEDHKPKRYRQSGWANLILPVVDPQRTPGSRVLAAWFHENVGASAWGLATHKGAKLLAVSSNTKEINIFAPSLSSDPLHWAFRSTYPRPERMERYKAWEEQGPIALRDRSLGIKITLRGHVAHIPSIAFCDNNLDPEGSYLASTDIDGSTIVWNIWGGTRILEIRGDASPPHRGWAVACLDPKRSVLSEGPVDTFGCFCRVDESNTLINNSEAGLSVHNNSQWHPGFSTLGSVPGMLPTGTMPPAIQTAGQAAAAISPDQDFEIEDEAEDEDEVDEEMDETDYLDDAFDEDALDEDEDAIPPSVFSHTVDATENYHLPSGESSIPESEDSDLPDLEEIPVIDQTDQQMTEAGEEENTLLSRIVKTLDRISDTIHTKSCVDLPFNLLQADERDIHLFRDIRFDANLWRHPPDSSHSQVLCQRALNQRMPPGFGYLTQMERLNMVAQIPELGVVVIGNQVGRVGILTMTRWEARKQSGYKIECIPPFDSEESKGLRPRKPLMGMAVGPIQGQEAALPQESPRMRPQYPRRFRLLMTYCDHTILSYEIFRPNGEEELLVV